MATFRTSQCQDGDENFRALKDALENLNTRAQIRVHQQGFWREFCQKSLFLVPWVHGSFISLGYPQNSWGVEVNPSPKIRCFTLMPTPLVAILYFPLTSLVFFGFPIQRTAIPTTRLRPSEKRELFRKLFLNNFCKHVLELYCSSITWPAETCHWSCSPWRCFTLGDWPVEPVLCCLISPSTEAIVKGTFSWNL